MIKFIAKYAPKMIVIKSILAITSIFVNIAFNIVFFKYVVDSMEYGGDFKSVLFFITGIAIIAIIDGILNSLFSQIVSPICMKRVHKSVHDEIFKKICTVELARFDDTEFYNEYIYALNEADSCIINSFNIIFSFFTNIISALLFSSITALYDPVLFVFSLVPIAVSVIVSSITASVNVKKRDANIHNERVAGYSQRVMYLQQYAKELRLYPTLKKIVLEKFDSSVDKQIDVDKKYGAKLTLLSFINDNFQMLFGVLLMALYISYKVIIKGMLSAGVFVAMFTAVNNFSFSIGAIFNAIPQIKQNGMFSEKVINILEYKSTIEREEDSNNIDQIDFFNITFDNVSFKYPHAENYIIKNLSFEINKNDKIAFVGLNGAGKTTILKLLLRLYDPTEGRILIDGQDIRTLNIQKYRKLFCVVFQDFQLYAFSVGENILMHGVNGDMDNSLISDALEKSGLADFIDKMESPITKEFDPSGILPSGGQSQKIAVARAFAHSGNILIMDEASSALDPVSEYKINQILAQSAQDKTLIIVSHRLASVQYTDKILYLEDGCIKEEGSHMELIKLNGKYAEMYELQAESYRI